MALKWMIQIRLKWMGIWNPATYSINISLFQAEDLDPSIFIILNGSRPANHVPTAMSYLRQVSSFDLPTFELEFEVASALVYVRLGRTAGGCARANGMRAAAQADLLIGRLC